MFTKPNLVDTREQPGNGSTIDHLTDASSLELMEVDAARLPATDEYKLYQHRENSWSHNGDWGEHAVQNANRFWGFIGRTGIVFEDDVFCDFGGNDGTVAEAWRRPTGHRVYSVDLDSLKQSWGTRSYPEVTFVNAFLENVPLDDNSVDWGYCSHTLEHVANLDKSMSEMARIVKRALFVVVPLEHAESFWKSDPHMRASVDPLDWLRHLRHPDFLLANWGKATDLHGGQEMYMLYVTDDYTHGDDGPKPIDLNQYYLDESCPPAS